MTFRKFLTGQPLVEKPVDHPQLRIQAKMKRVGAGIERWLSSGKDPSAVGQLNGKAPRRSRTGGRRRWSGNQDCVRVRPESDIRWSQF